MNSSQYKKGMMVRVADSLPQTKRSYTTNNRMQAMRGKIFKLDCLNTTNKGGYIQYEGFNYMFRLEELQVVKKTEPISPVTFKH